jgi:hypothetical protein
MRFIIAIIYAMMRGRALVFAINHEDERPGLLAHLPTRFAIAAAATAAAVALPTAATTTTITAIATATTAVATEPTSATTATATILTRLGFVDFQGTATDFSAIHLFNSGSSFFRSRHFDEGKTSRTARQAIFDHAC